MKFLIILIYCIRNASIKINESSFTMFKPTATTRIDAKVLVYDRNFPTGLGYRISVYVAVAAFARTQHSVVYAYWFNEDFNTERI